MHDALILGIDPGIAKGKPIAMALVRYADGERQLVWHCTKRVQGRFYDDRIAEWVLEFEDILTRGPAGCCQPITMVAIEDARPRNRGGANLQHLVNVLKQRSLARKLRTELIPPAKVKLHATGNGAAETEVVALFVREEVKGFEKVEIVAGEYDTEMAAAIAGAGYAKLQREAGE